MGGCVIYIITHAHTHAHAHAPAQSPTKTRAAQPTCTRHLAAGSNGTMLEVLGIRGRPVAPWCQNRVTNLTRLTLDPGTKGRPKWQSEQKCKKVVRKFGRSKKSP